MKTTLAVLLGALLLGLPAGFLLGRLGGGEAAPDPAFRLDPVGGSAIPRDPTTALETAAAPDVETAGNAPDPEPASPGTAEPAAPPAGPRPLAIELLDARGAVLGRFVAVRVVLADGGNPLVCAALPLEHLAGAHQARLREGAARRGLQRVAFTAPAAGWAFLTDPGPGPAFALREDAAALAEGDAVVLVEADETFDEGAPALLGEPVWRPGESWPRRALSAGGAREGAAVLDAEGRLLGLALRSAGEGRAALLVLDRARLGGVTRHDLPLAEYTRTFWAGRPEARLQEALRALDEGRFAAAVEAFRDVGRARPDLSAPHRDGWLAAHRALVDGVAPGDVARRLAALERAVADLPDEADLWLEFADASLGAGLHRQALDALARAGAADAALAASLDPLKSGVYRDWVETLERQGRIEEAVAVLAEARRAVRGDASLWALDGQLRMKIRDYAGAAAAFRDAMALAPERAAVWADVAARAARLADGPGKVALDYDPSRRTILATVSINGARGEFIVDTGATSTFVPEELARRAGLAFSEASPHVVVRTAGGDRTLPVVAAGRIGLGALAVDGLNVIVGDLPGTGQRGLLGMDFLGRFAFENDAVGGRFVLYEKP